jgi:hypothetical protein
MDRLQRVEAGLVALIDPTFRDRDGGSRDRRRE